MSDSAEMFDLYETDPADGAEHLVGQADYGPGGTLTITRAEPARDAFLRDVAVRVNAKPTLSALAPPEPGAPRHSLGTHTVARDSPDFLDALQRYLTTYYNLRLG